MPWTVQRWCESSLTANIMIMLLCVSDTNTYETSYEQQDNKDKKKNEEEIRNFQRRKHHWKGKLIASHMLFNIYFGYVYSPMSAKLPSVKSHQNSSKKKRKVMILAKKIKVIDILETGVGCSKAGKLLYTATLQHHSPPITLTVAESSEAFLSLPPIYEDLAWYRWSSWLLTSLPVTPTSCHPPRCLSKPRLLWS